MLSIAYGADQSDANQLHYPEVCYPAQGFQLLKINQASISTQFGEIRTKQLIAVLGLRTEPVTYWTTVADKVVRGSKETKLAQLKYGFNGQIPDGLLFRVSTVTQDTDRAFALQKLFVKDLSIALKSDFRAKLMGL
jgi:EpsI family protein